MANKKLVWFDSRNINENDDLLKLVFNLRYEFLLVRLDAVGKMQIPHRMKLIVEVLDEDDLEGLPADVIVFTANEDILKNAKEIGFSTAYYQKIEDENSMNLAWKTGRTADYLVVELVSATNIPLELIIAKLQVKDTTLLKMVRTALDAEIAYGVMEVGSDGIVLSSGIADEVLKLDKLMQKEETGKLELTRGKVLSVEHIGMGYRACIDTTNLLKENEGMIIGSTSQGGLLVSSETHFLPYMELRPFRVNAGAVHSYVWAPDGMTAYITELKAGSRLLCVDTEGNTREVTVGRVKTEMRPLLKIEIEAKGARLNTIIQDDWHIRIFGADGEVRNASDIQPGDELMSFVCSGGRHVGIGINEHIQEK